MANTLKLGARDLCACCNQPIIWDSWRFWEDTEEIIPKGPPYVHVPWGHKPTAEQEAKIKAYDNWQEHLKTRPQVNVHGGKHFYKDETWMHIVSWPIEKRSDLRRACKGTKNQNATPSSWCMVSQNSGGDCKRVAKEIVDTGYGGKKAMCGIHLAHVRKAQRQAEEQENQSAIEAWKAEELERKIAELAKYGVKAGKEWVRHNVNSYYGSYTGKVVVDPDKLLEILQDAIEVF